MRSWTPLLRSVLGLGWIGLAILKLADTMSRVDPWVLGTALAEGLIGLSVLRFSRRRAPLVASAFLSAAFAVRGYIPAAQGSCHCLGAVKTSAAVRQVLAYSLLAGSLACLRSTYAGKEIQ